MICFLLLLGKLLRFCFPPVLSFQHQNQLSNFEMFLMLLNIYAFTEGDGIKHFAELVPNSVQGYSVQKYYCGYVTCLCRKQLEDILSNLKEKPDVGTLLLVSHQMMNYWHCFTCYT
jgi:hypothetical protein